MRDPSARRRPVAHRVRSYVAHVGAFLLFAGAAFPLVAQDGESSAQADDTEPASEIAAGAPAIDPTILDAEKVPRVAASLLLDVASNGGGLVAVGERGHVLTSSDGETWSQAERVPTRSTLTTVASVGERLFAAGHDGVILRSDDHGRSWQRQRVAPWRPDDFDPTHGVPVLDLLFTDADHGMAVGAYSLLLVTEDGGETWTARAVNGGAEVEAPAEEDAPSDDDWTFSADELELEDEADPHFNAIARTGSGALFIAGERGSVFRSTDGGQAWDRLNLPYEGSMLGVLTWPDDRVLVFGLRGNAYETRDLGASWQQVPTGTGASLMGGVALADGGALLVGANGAVIERASGDAPFAARTFTNVAGETPVLAAVQPADGGGYVIVGDRGVARVRPE